ncbi:hypothetical protein [Streptomyces sp. NPDC020965]|uniref:hypothetical protein n=1 Tax=Streptomyces sp. NPDC020965 TaxID=3365105 RepID=UPI0037A91ECD
MLYGRVVRAVCCAVACGLLWTGCSGASAGGPDGRDGGSEPPRRPSAGGTESGGPGPKPSGSSAPAAFVPDPARIPRTAAAAAKLVDAVLAGPELWGPGYVRRTPFLSAPGYWPVLDEKCVWQSGSRPSDVLHTRTSYSELPAAAGKGPIRVAATVTVHRTGPDAEWEMAETLEEALRCPGQKLRDGERISGLLSIGRVFGSGGNFTAEDSIGELGRYHNDAFGKAAYEYAWYQSRIGQVTIATVTKGAKGHSEDEINNARAEAMTGMVVRAEKQLEAAE